LRAEDQFCRSAFEHLGERDDLLGMGMEASRLQVRDPVASHLALDGELLLAELQDFAAFGHDDHLRDLPVG